MATNGVCNSFKAELLEGGHCFNAAQSGVSVTNTSGTATLAGTFAGLAVGMSISGTGVPAGAVVAAWTSSSVTMSAVSTAAITSVTFAGDTLKMLLIKAAPSLTYGPTQTNVGTPGTGTPSTANVGTDETSGTGYTSGGETLGNVQPSVPSTPGTVGTTSFSPNPSWTSATFSATAGIVYNGASRLGTSGRTAEVLDFAGTQSVSNGTFTVLMPTNDGNNAVLRIA